MSLTPEAYDAAERAALPHVPNRIVEACQTVAFGQEGYPGRIPTPEAAVRYVDVMQDGRSEGTFTALLGGITADELDLMGSLAGKVAALTETRYGRRLVPRSGMLRALNVVRHIRHLLPDTTSAVLEIGPGSGYVGALLMELGYGYAATDIAQAFYVYQNHLMHALAPGRVIELATEPGGFLDLAAIPAGHAVHVPWWKFVLPAPRANLRLHAVTCNHALCEMHSSALNYTARVAADLLAAPGDRYFVFEGWGSTIRAPIWHAGRALSRAGLCFAHNDVHSSILVRRDADAARQALALPPPGQTDGEAAFHPPIYVNPASTLSTALLRARAATAARATLGLPDVDRMLRQVVGSQTLDTDDERFMAFVNDHRH
jgi:hypothetical protein